MRGYTQLTQEERYQIYVLKKAGHNQTVIASLLGRDKSTISRELRRNRGLKGYRPRRPTSWRWGGVTTRLSLASANRSGSTSKRCSASNGVRSRSPAG